MATYDPNSSGNVLIKRSLRYKILFLVLPLFLISFSFFSITTYFSIKKSITNVVKEFVGYKLKEIVDFSLSLFVDSSDQIVENKSGIPVIKGQIFEYAKQFEDTILVIIPYNYESINKNIDNFTVNTNSFTSNNIDDLYALMKEQDVLRIENPEKYTSWLHFDVQKEKFVGVFIPIVELQSWFLLFIRSEEFYKPVTETMMYLNIIVVVSLIILIILILFFVNFLTNPLNHCVNTIKKITENKDFSKRVRIFYPDEIGILGQYFNNMIQELEKYYNQIKNYAYQTVLAKKREERIRFIFQKYVPSDVIEHVLHRSTDSMLIGSKQTISVLFSDIRDFTTISEELPPEKLVLSLNAYFTEMVQKVINNKGIVDKFIGDAIMALFGAPVSRVENADDALNTALEMIEGVKSFNKKQQEHNEVTFQIGIGINTGIAVVGNIGSEQKIEYTVIGDVVNLGARLEGLTKYYQMPILISEFTKNAVSNQKKYVFINIDTVRVKGKNLPVVIYSVRLKSSVSQEEQLIYEKFHFAQQHYYQGQFQKAYDLFIKISSIGYIQPLLKLYIERCNYLLNNPPTHWDGVENWKSK